MARSYVELNPQNPKEFKEKAEALLVENHYNQVNEYGEDVWKNGVGFLTASKYIKIEIEQDRTVVYAWIRGVAGGDMGVNGIVGIIPKQQVKKILTKIAQLAD